MDYSRIITIDPAKRSGQPCIRGLRMTVEDVLGCLASGMSADEILSDFPDLTSDDIQACLAYAADRERRLIEIKSAVAQLLPDELATFARWFEEHMADAWDRRIEADAKAGRLDEAGRQADADFIARRFTRP